jgi:general stress protein 26
MPKTRATENPDIAHLAELIEGIPYVSFTSVRGDGSLHSRPMAVQEQDFDGSLWFFTGQDSAKVDEIGADAHVSVAFADPGRNKWVSIAGTARLVTDRAKIRELWSRPVEAFFPGGPDDPNVALLHVEARTAWYWDGPSSKIVRAYDFAKAILTHADANDMADSGRVDL